MGLSLSDFNPFRAAKKVTKAVAKPFRKASKFIPKELRWAAPYLAAAAPYTSFMMPAGIGSSALGRTLLSSLYNVAGQGIADPEGEDVNLLSTLLAGGQGYLTGEGVGQGLRDMTTRGKWGIGSVPDQISGVPENILKDRSFLTKAKDLGLTGLGEVADYLGGAKETLGALGAGEAIPIETSKIVKNKLIKETLMKDLFTKAGAKKGLMAAAPIFTQGTGDVFKAEGDKALRAYEAADLEEQRKIDETTTANEEERATLQMTFLRQAGHDEETIKETLAQNDLQNYYEPPVEEAAQGGIIGLKNGGSLFNDTFSLSERLNPRDAPNQLIAEHMQIGKLPFNITERIFELNRGGKSYEDIAEITGVDIEDITSMLEVANKPYRIDPVDEQGNVDYNIWDDIMAENISIRERPEHLSYNAKGGIIGLKHGGMLNLGGNEMDYRGGGFVPIGKKERADDVPARLSKNEFVMTADAVKAAGGGSVNKGAQRMYNVMNQLEARA